MCLWFRVTIPLCRTSGDGNGQGCYYNELSLLLTGLQRQNALSTFLYSLSELMIQTMVHDLTKDERESTIQNILAKGKGGYELQNWRRLWKHKGFKMQLWHKKAAVTEVWTKWPHFCELSACLWPGFAVGTLHQGTKPAAHSGAAGMSVPRSSGTWCMPASPQGKAEPTQTIGKKALLFFQLQRFSG